MSLGSDSMIGLAWLSKGRRMLRPKLRAAPAPLCPASITPGPAPVLTIPPPPGGSRLPARRLVPDPLPWRRGRRHPWHNACAVEQSAEPLSVFNLCRMVVSATESIGLSIAYLMVHFRPAPGDGAAGDWIPVGGRLLVF